MRSPAVSMSNRLVAVAASRSSLVCAAPVTPRALSVASWTVPPVATLAFVAQVLSGVTDHPQPVGGRVEVDSEGGTLKGDAELGTFVATALLVSRV